MSKLRCKDCGTTADVHAVPLPGTIPGTALGHTWLCGGCEYLRGNPDAVKLEAPKRRSKTPQAEQLPFSST